ncbi:uncharacterized protein BJ171DRAFT_220912 [Polychytrium aggregatum]|uniref:uncharacterized protein n=1 Tax=Polychytrium aggregatum TaxID=110093 RepID=UPI0022FE978C|nr:uncharacterized protein BJ171DRAFT_220912 [Polychytrium aggregatum]KAI9197448.1 hypothetical protein BJ171DRAFT_220912 [Polychytrium aggregatum]
MSNPFSKHRIPPRGSARPRVRAHVRSEPIWSRIKSAPGDFWMRLGEWWASWDSEAIFESISIPTAVGVATIHTIVSIIFNQFLEAEKDVQNLDSLNLSLRFRIIPDFPAVLDASTSHQLVRYGLFFAQTSLCTLSLLNSIFLFRRSKRFVLFREPVNESEPAPKFKSPNAQIIEINVDQTQFDDGEDDEQDMNEDEEDPALSPSKPKRTRAWWPLTPKRDSGPEERKQKLEKKWVLNVWNPSVSSLNFFIIFSPPTALTLSYSTEDTVLTCIFQTSLVSLALYLLVKAFRELLHDQEILKGQLLQEYSVGFVYKQYPFKAKNDAACGDSDSLPDDHLRDRVFSWMEDTQPADQSNQ